MGREPYPPDARPATVAIAPAIVVTADSSSQEAGSAIATQAPAPAVAACVDLAY
jgi:hypothetical protein